MGKIIRRILTIIPAVALQSLWLLLLMKWLTPYAPIIVSLLSVAAFFLVVFIIIKRDETAYKLLWLLVILSLPLVGALLYLLFGNKRTARPLKRRLQQVQKSCNPQPLPIKEAPFDGEKRMGQTVRWLEEKTQYPMCAVEQVRYYPLGDNMFPDMLADLKNARNSIYVEYFIIEPGHMWDAIVNELEVKMEQGVDVRVIYDDLGSISSFNFSNVRELKKKGIPCIPFNPFLALKGTANYRDHRKMLIIDNKVAYSGGINLADRYINLEHPYGHWKDTGFRITGEPVKNFTHMFLTFWNAFSLEKEAGQLAMPTYPKRYPAPPHTFDGYGYQRAESHEDIFCEGTPTYKLLSSGAERMYQYIRSAGYDNIICTHVFPALALTEMRRQHPCLQLVTSHVSTDYTCAPCTADSALDWYFIPSTSLLGEFEQCGLQPQKLIASGIPVRQQFYQRVSQEAGKANAGISPAHQHILMMCGSMGCGPMEEIISYLCPYLTTEQELSVVCGTNDDLRKKLQKRTEKYSQVHVLGTVNNVPQLMQASDLFLTKPGGLSTSEAMAAELPMVLIDAVAGCETHNLNFFLRNGMAVTANTPKAIADTTIKTLNAPVLLSKMRAAMRSQTECTAADKIYEWIYSHAK